MKRSRGAVFALLHSRSKINQAYDCKRMRWPQPCSGMPWIATNSRRKPKPYAAGNSSSQGWRRAQRSELAGRPGLSSRIQARRRAVFRGRAQRARGDTADRRAAKSRKAPEFRKIPSWFSVPDGSFGNKSDKQMPMAVFHFDPAVDFEAKPL